MTVIGFSNILTAFDAEAIGSRVLDGHQGYFLDGLRAAIERHDSSGDRVPGQHFIVCPELKDHVSAGDGPKSDDPADYVVRSHRETPHMYLRREKAGEVQFVACVVYTLEAYGRDPEVDAEELARLQERGCSHVLVAVIASSGPAAPVTPFRFVSNLAGGNREYECPAWDCDNQDSSEVIDILSKHIEFLEDKAREVKDYWINWSVVAD
jgi:hypothetical protein